jgi:hypothetical protein
MRAPGVELVRGGQQEFAAIECRGVTPRVSDEWFTDLLEELLPYAAEAVHRCASSELSAFAIEHTRYPLSFPFETLAEYGIDPLDPAGSDGNSGLQGDYAAAIAEYAIRYYGRDEAELSRPEQREALEARLSSIGTGEGFRNAGVDTLSSTIAPIFATLAPDVGVQRPLVRLYFDATAWADVEDNRTARRALDALAALAEGLPIEIVVTSPQLGQLLWRQHSAWLEAETDLTGFRDWWGGHDTGVLERADADTRAIVADALADLSEGSGRVRLLAALEDRQTTVKALKRDAAVSLADGSIDRYTRELEADGLVRIDERSDQSNAVALTSAGELVVDHIAADYSLRDPSQTAFAPRSYADPSPQRKYSVSDAARSGGGERVPSADAALSATGTADAGDGDYVQWLDGPDAQIDAWGQHQRLSAAKRATGVNLVDASIDEFDDGRTTYISCFDDEFLTVLQWGGPLVTLGRLANALLSRDALSKVLAPESVGHEFQHLFGGPSEWIQYDEDLEDLLRLGTQVGWFSEDEEEWDGFFDRITGVRAAAMEELGAVVGSNDQERRSELFRDLHGLVATATAMYDAAGVDVTIDLRIPDIKQLVEDDYRREQFHRFFTKTVTKQALYRSGTGEHSWFRTCVEDRPEKLQYRLPPGYSPDTPTAELTASWIVRGPTATALQDDLEDAIETEISELRERVVDGTEPAPVLEVPVVDATTIPHIRSVLQDVASMKNYRLPRDGRYTTARFTDQDAARLCIEFLATGGNPHGCNPSDVAEALLRLSKTDFDGDQLTRSDLEYAFSQLPGDRLLPEKRPTTTRMFQALLAADEPLGRSDIIERADISGSTYDRRIDEFRAEFTALGLLKEVSVNGYDRMIATLEPYWARADGRDDHAVDYSDDVVDDIEAVLTEHAPGLSRQSRPKDILFEVAAALGIDLQDPAWNYDRLIEDVYRLDSALASWRPLLVGLLEDLNDLNIQDDESVAVLGRYPDAVSAAQRSLTQTIQGVKSSNGVVNGLHKVESD